MKKNISFLFVISILFFNCSSDKEDFYVDETYFDECEGVVRPNDNELKSAFLGYDSQDSGSSVIILTNDVYVKVESVKSHVLYPGSSNTYKFSYYANGTSSSRLVVYSPFDGLVFLPDWTSTSDYFKWKSFWACGSSKMSNMTNDLQGKLFVGMFPGPVLAVIGSVCLLDEFGVHIPEGKGLMYFNGLNRSGLDLVNSYDVVVGSDIVTSEELLEEILVELEKDSVIFGGYLTPRDYYREMKYEYGYSDLEIIEEFRKLHVI